MQNYLPLSMKLYFMSGVKFLVLHLTTPQEASEQLHIGALAKVNVVGFCCTLHRPSKCFVSILYNFENLPSLPRSNFYRCQEGEFSGLIV
jgi:hypothetical protein